MKLTAVLAIKMKKGIFPQFIATLYKHQMEISNISLIESDGKWDEYAIEIIYNSKKDMIRVVEGLKKNTEMFREISITSTLEDNIRGGLLLTQGKIQIDTNNDIETSLIGAAMLMHEKIDSGLGGQYCSVSNCVGVISSFKKMSGMTNEFYHYFADSERDSIIISRFTGKNASPVAVKYQSVEDMIRIMKGIESNYCCIRLINSDIDDHLYCSTIAEALTKPVISREMDEIPLYLISIIMRICKKQRYKPEETSVGIMGLNSSMIRLTGLLCGAGYIKVLGFDNKERVMMSFESQGGLATTGENVADNADILIIQDEQILAENIQFLRAGQVVIRGAGVEPGDASIFSDKGIKEIIYLNETDLLSLIPPMVRGITAGENRQFTDDLMIRVSAVVSKEMNEDYRLPGFFSESAGKIEFSITKG